MEPGSKRICYHSLGDLKLLLHKIESSRKQVGVCIGPSAAASYVLHACQQGAFFPVFCLLFNLSSEHPLSVCGSECGFPFVHDSQLFQTNMLTHTWPLKCQVILLVWQIHFSLCSAKGEIDHVSDLFSKDLVTLEVMLLAFSVTSDFFLVQELLVNVFINHPGFSLNQN